MAETQTYAHHTRWDPIYHFFVVPVFLLSLIGGIVHLVRRPGLHAAWFLIFLAALCVLAVKARLYANKVQDRVIRLEQRLRLATLLSEPLRSSVSELTEEQLIGLRFASDAECPGLVQRALAEKLSRDVVKKAILNWQPDNFRV
jgi:hypothetical protein